MTLRKLLHLLFSVILLPSLVFALSNKSNLANETLAPKTLLPNSSKIIVKPKTSKNSRISQINNDNSLLNYPFFKIKKFINFDLPGYFSLSVRYDSGVHSLFFKPDYLYPTNEENIVEAISDEQLFGNCFIVSTFNIKTGKILDLTLHKEFPKKYFTTKKYQLPIVLKIKKKDVNEITSHENGTIKFVLTLAHGGSYFYTKHDPKALIRFENNKFFVHMYDKDRKIYLYLVLKSRKKNLYLTSEEYDFDFITGVMSNHPIKTTQLMNLKLEPHYNKLQIPSLKPLLKSIVTLFDGNPNSSKLITYSA